MLKSSHQFNRRQQRTRAKIAKRKNQRIRLSVFRSNQYIYAQLIDDQKSITLASASSLETEVRNDFPKGYTVDAAVRVGELIAARGKKVNINEVVFDKGGYPFHGRIKALADAARQHGLNF